MVQTKFLCCFVIKNLVEHGNRPKVQLAIKYIILGIFNFFNIGIENIINLICLYSWVQIQEIYFKEKIQIQSKGDRHCQIY